MIKEFRDYIRRYFGSKNRSIYEVYARPSIAKQQAESDIIDEMLANNGYDYRVLTHNKMMFTCAYWKQDKNGHKLIVHTPTRRIEIPLN